MHFVDLAEAISGLAHIAIYSRLTVTLAIGHHMLCKCTNEIKRNVSRKIFAFDTHVSMDNNDQQE